MSAGTSAAAGLPRRLLVVLVALLAAALVGSLVLSPPAVAGGGGKPGKSGKVRTADKPWSGFATRTDGRASGGFLGARLVGPAVVYRIDPQARKPLAKGFGPATYVDTLAGTGKKKVTALDTQQAAWIVGKYGAYRLKIQNAAVELALDDLLVGGKFSLKGAQTERRLAQLPRSKRQRVLTFARKMLKGAAAYASTYAVTMTSTPSVRTGEAVTASLRVTSTATGAGIANLPVTFTYPGAAPVAARTDATGTAAASFTATAAGPQTISGSVANVPESRLIVLQPTNSKASRVVVADVKTASSATAITAVRAAPVLTMPATYAAIEAGAATAARATLAGTYATTRSATATLYGPFSSAAAAASCKAPSAGSGKVTMKANGGYAMPALKPSKVGWYRWGVSLPADTYNNAATVCAGRTQVVAAS